MLNKSKSDWDFNLLVTPKNKTLDLQKTPQWDLMYQRRRLANSFSLKSDQSLYEGGSSHVHLYNTLPSSQMSPIEYLGQDNRRLRFDGDFLPHRPQNEEDSNSFRKHQIIKRLNFEEELDEQNEQNLEEPRNSYFPSQNSRNSIHKQKQNHNDKVLKYKPKRKTRPKEKGLRQLSEHCFEIVKKQKRTNYKSVAQQLIEEMKEDNLLSNSDEKQESNVRRRVYDALNVLIALQVLSKKGKDIFYSKQLKSSEQKVLNDSKKSDLLKQISHKKLILEETRNKVNEMRCKAKNLDALIQRNRLVEKGDCVDLPFVSILFDNFFQDELQIQDNKIIMKCQGSYQFFGDIDAIMKLQFRSNQCIQIKKKSN